MILTFRNEKFEVKGKVLFPSFKCDYDELLKRDTPKAYGFLKQCGQEQALIGEYIDDNLVIYNLKYFLDALIDVLSLKIDI